MLVYVHAHVIGYVSDCVLLGVVMCYYHLLCNLWVFRIVLCAWLCMVM